MIDLKIALMVGLIGLLLLMVYFIALPNRMSIWRGVKNARAKRGADLWR
jgi:hypothetical protein